MANMVGVQPSIQDQVKARRNTGLPPWLTAAAQTTGQALGQIPGMMQSAVSQMGRGIGTALGNIASRAPEQAAPAAGNVGMGGPWMFPQGRGGGGGMGMPLDRATFANAWTNFPAAMQGSMNQIGSVLQGNADRMTQNRMAQMAYNAQMADIAARKNMGMNLLSMMSGRPLEQVQTGTQQVAGDPRVGPNGLVSTFRNEPVYDTRLGEATGGGTGGGFGGGNQISGFQFAGPNGVFGGANLPTPPWAGGGGGMANIGVDATPGQVWNPQYAQNAAMRLAGNATAPMGGPSSGAAQSGMNQMFADAMTNASTGNLSDLTRAGQQAEATHGLESQLAQSRLQNALWGQMGNFYGQNLKSKLNQDQMAYRMMMGLV